MGEKSRFSNAGLHAAETLFEGAHARAGQYLDQAPILVMWAHPWSRHWSDSAPTFARTWINGHCENGIGLKDFLRVAGFSAPMRAIHASVLLPSHAGLYRMLGRVPASTLGRCIPATKKAQRAWLRALEAWLANGRHAGRHLADTDVLFRWCVETLGDTTIEPAQVRDLRDFQLAAQGAFNTAWGLKRALEEMGAWHTRITLESQLRGLPVGADDAIDLGDQPDTWSVEPFTITALRTPRQIAEEGSAMRHCVATYISRVFNGDAHLVSITESGRRVATLEMGGPKAGARRWGIRQLKGPRNSPVRPSIEAMARLYSQLQSDRPRTGAARPEARS